MIGSRKLEIAALLALLPAGIGVRSRAQSVDLPGLWPHENGRAWTYTAAYEDAFVSPLSFDASLHLDGAGPGAGGVTVQYLWGSVGPGGPVSSGAPAGASGLQRALWRTRPDLRPRLRANLPSGTGGSPWPFLLLHPAAPDVELGFLATADRVGAWRDALASWSWTYLTNNLAVGSQFTLQLVPDLADDVFLHGEVQAVLPNMSTPAGTFDDVLIMSFVVDHGVLVLTSEGGDPLGTIRIETTGTVAFAMGQGPVQMQEETQVAESDCPTCTSDFLHEFWSRGQLTLTARSVPARASSFGGLKATYQR